jgi:16S rRNA (adenine1518-N6/adenine1519-N6)-dimethyltransferase
VPPGLGRRALRELAARHGLTPTKALGQHFLADPNLARWIVGAAGVEPGDRVLEVGPGLGSLTVALASAGASVLAVELDRAVVPALSEAVAGLDVTVLRQDAMNADWSELLAGPGTWKMASNLPYNVAVPLLLGMLEAEPPIERYVVMVQREVGERLVAGPGDEGYGAPSVRVAYHASARLLRRVPPTVFWPEPKVESVLVSLEPREAPPVEVDPAALFRVVEEGFAQRRKTMRNALVRLGLEGPRAEEVLASVGVEPQARAEELGLAEFAAIAGAFDGSDG